MEDIIYWIWLSILNLKPIEKIKLIEYFKEPKVIYKLSLKELEKLTDSKELMQKLIDKNKKKEAYKILEEATKNKVKIITCNNPIYPKRLKQIYDYPIVLCAKGNLKLLNEKSITIVGSRNCSEYGKYVSEKFSYLLSQKNICIVSGMAKGIDASAHKGALLAKGKTIVVLGSGVNNIYPLENKKLYEDILNNNGLILSEYGVNTKPTPEKFPERNRILSGLSEKILVVEASRKSGSIITANQAIEQGKNVYAIPGNITSSKSSGTNELIKDGAILVSSLEDIIDL